MVYEFCSTSKVAFPGDGIAAFATSPANMIAFKNYLKQGTIGPDKINQLRQVRYFHSIGEMKKHMKKQADIMRPKFEMVERILEEELGSAKIASWTNPRGRDFHLLRYDGGLREADDRTVPGCRSKIYTGGSNIPIWKRSERLQYPDRSVFCIGGGDRDGDKDLCGQRQTGDP